MMRVWFGPAWSASRVWMLRGEPVDILRSLSMMASSFVTQSRRLNGVEHGSVFYVSALSILVRNAAYLPGQH